MVQRSRAVAEIHHARECARNILFCGGNGIRKGKPLCEPRCDGAGESVVPYAKQLQEKGAQNVLISMAGEGAVLVAASGEVFEAPAPKGKLINGVGAGDSMVAGFMAGYMEKEDYLHAFHMGIAAGSASAFSENLATREEIASVYEQITK